MKILVLGDIHGRDWWNDIIDSNPDVDRIVFLGDYVSSHHLITSEQQIAVTDAILSYKEENSDKVVLLRGNHDIQHLEYSWAECSGYDSNVAQWMVSQKERFLKNTQWCYIHNNLLFSHAGVSSVWMKNSKINDVNSINDLEPTELFGFTPDIFFDMSGDSKTQPLTWIRPEILIKYMIPGYTQIVGHTSVKFLCNLNKELNYKYPNDLWLCDTHLTEYLIIENNEFIVKKSEKVI